MYTLTTLAQCLKSFLGNKVKKKKRDINAKLKSKTIAVYK